MPKTLFLKMPANFSFKQTVYSHGWSELSPFELDKENWRLSYVFTDKDSKKAISATISDDGENLKIILADGKMGTKIEEKILRDISHILRFDDDLTRFHAHLKTEERLAWIAEKNVGRLLRSPTVFEDLVKTICTTNCSWSLTKKMIANLVEKLGVETKSGKRAFPTAEAMAKVSPEFYRDEMRAGYRAPYFAELAEKVAAGKLDPETWLNSDLPTNELKKEMKKVKGVGDYAAENLLKLVGRYDGLALDSFLRSQFYKIHNREKVCKDKKIEAFYKKFGEWRGLAIWCDMTERWLN
jgi:3-methyladenine DNA glycosylase/8-oxoguanine DNA glycosylase